MSYDQYRLAQITSFNLWQLSQFLNGFDSSKPTVILLPGGMGSQLDRTQNPYPDSPNGMDITIWVDLIGMIFEQDALKLEIERNLHDKDSFVVAADGPLRCVLTTPYDDFVAFARHSGWNIFVYGYDWRRPLAESADLFKAFIYEFRARLMKHGPDPVPKLNIVCHSMGGLSMHDRVARSPVLQAWISCHCDSSDPLLRYSARSDARLRLVALADLPACRSTLNSSLASAVQTQAQHIVAAALAAQIASVDMSALGCDRGLVELQTAEPRHCHRTSAYNREFPPAAGDSTASRRRPQSDTQQCGELSAVEHS
jgi:hypothetical protein